MHTNTHTALSGARWFTSSYSNAQGGECVEGAALPGGQMAIRDTKDHAARCVRFPGACLACLPRCGEGGRRVRLICGDEPVRGSARVGSFACPGVY